MDMQANAPIPQRLRKNILLLLQMLILAAIVIALAKTSSPARQWWGRCGT